MKVLISDPLAEEGIEKLREREDIEVDVKIGLSKDELISCIQTYDALIVRSETKVTKDVIEAGKNLKLIGRAGVGIDNIDVESATKRGIIVMNAPTGNTITTAEHTMAMMLALSRNIPQANASLKRKEWDRKRFMGVELYQKTLGIIGLGRIGGEVAKRAKAFGMKILAYDPFISRERANKLGVELVELDELCRRSDYITLHTPKTPRTIKILSEREFNLMKEGVRIINCARGGLIDEEVLYKKLKEGKVAGAALDVFEQKKPFDSPLLELENCITVPHLGASTYEAQVNVALEMADQVIDALHGGAIRNALNIPQVPPEVLQEIQPFLSLAEKLGSIQAQLAEGRIERMSVEYCGEITREDVTAITVACVKGMIEGVLQDAVVNYVNASYLAKERGIDVLESKVGKKSDFVNLISVKVKTEKEERLIAGTLFQREDPRIVYIDNFRIDAVPAGHLLILTQTDEPGIIGNVGTILGKRGVNIGWLQLAREAIGGKAMSVWNVDAPISQEILDEITSLREVLDAKLVVL